jgi:hypothetical protein
MATAPMIMLHRPHRCHATTIIGLVDPVGIPPMCRATWLVAPDLMSSATACSPGRSDCSCQILRRKIIASALIFGAAPVYCC